MDSEKETIKFYFEKEFSAYAITKKLAGLKVSESKIYRVCRRLKEGKAVDNRHLSGRRRFVRTASMVKRVRERIRRHPQRSARRMACQLGISDGLLRRIIKEDLGLKPYKKRKVHGLTDAQKEKRLVRSKQLLERHGSSDLEQLVFSDEKLFSVQEKLNSQNTCIYSLSIEDIPEHLRTVQRFQSEDKVMVWCAVSKKGKFPLVFVESGVKINAQYYIANILDPILKEHSKVIYSEQHWTFQQDSAPAHKAKITQAWCRNNCPNFISSTDWPPSSPDLNPLDYSIWGILEARVNAIRHRSIDSLKASLIREWDKLSIDTVRAAIDIWPNRLKNVIKQHGGRFE
jgi:hypothetical protein